MEGVRRDIGRDLDFYEVAPEANQYPFPASTGTFDRGTDVSSARAGEKMSGSDTQDPSPQRVRNLSHAM